MGYRTNEINNMTIDRIESSTIRSYITDNNIEMSVEECIIIIYNSSDSLETKYVILDTIREMIKVGFLSNIDKSIKKQLDTALKDIRYLMKLINSENGNIFAKYSNGEIYCANRFKNIYARYGDEINIFSNNGTKEFIVSLNRKNEISSYKKIDREENILNQYIDIKNDINIGDTVYDIDDNNEDKTEFIVVNKSEALNYEYSDNIVIVVPKKLFDESTKIKDTIEETYINRIKNFFSNNENDKLATNMSTIHITKVERIQRYEE